MFDEAGITHASRPLARIQPPDHTRLRGFIQKAFTPRRVAAARARGPRADGRADRADGRGRHAPIWLPTSRIELPALVIFHLLGVPDVDVAAGQGLGAEPRATQLRRPAGRPSRCDHAENLVGVLALLRRPRRGELRAAARRPHRRRWRASTSKATSRSRRERDRRPDPHPAVRRARDDDVAARRGAQGAARAARALAELCDDPTLIPTAVEEMLRLVHAGVHLEAHDEAPATVSATSTCRRAPTSCCCSAPPTATRASSPSRRAHRSPPRERPQPPRRSATASTSASARRSRASRCRSCSRSSPAALPGPAPGATGRASSTGATPPSAGRRRVLVEWGDAARSRAAARALPPATTSRSSAARRSASAR